MAPIRGVSNFIYRSTFAKYFSGYDEALTPFIVTHSQVKFVPQELRDILPTNNKVGFKIVPQLLSNSPKDFIEVAKALFDYGYQDINWNLGCPFTKVAKKKRGSGLLPYPELIESFLNEVVPAIPNKLSIKVRFGYHEKNELRTLLPRLDGIPLTEIIIHARTAAQAYKGEVDVDEFAACLSLTKHVVMYNGDINSVEDFERLSTRFPQINRWMIGRGGIVNPFLPEIIKRGNCISDGEKIKILKSFNEDLTEMYFKVYDGAQSHVLDKMKGMWLYWSQAFKHGENIRQRICRLKSKEKYLLESNKFLDHNPWWIA